MDAKKGEGADQQSGHAPECIVQVRIFIPVMMGCMGKIAGKFSVGAGMTFFAGLHHMAPIQIGL
jgi:hypothetical protein